MFRCLKSSSAPSYYGFIESRGEKLYVVALDAKTHKVVQDLTIVVKEKYSSIKKFVEDIPSIFTSNFKTVLLNIFYFKAPEFTNNYKFCEAIKAQLDFIGISYYFAMHSNIRLTSLFASTKSAVKVEDTAMIVFMENDKYLVGEFQFTENGYKSIPSYYVNANQEPEIIRKEILRSSKPAKVVGTSLIHDVKNMALLGKLQNILQKSDGLVICECKSLSVWLQGVIKVSKWILDNSYVKYRFLPKSQRKYFIFIGRDEDETDVLTNMGCNLPDEITEFYERSHAKHTLAYTDYDYPYPVYLEPIIFDIKCHRFKITLKVDINNFYSYQIEPIIFDQIKNLPAFLDRIEMPKIPVIIFVDNLSFICVHKNGEYEFVDEWNGVYGEDLLISFADEKPKFCQEATNDFKIKPTSVVFDLIRILSMPADKIDAHPLWSFTITKDDDNPVLTEFDNFNGTKKAASPASLMTMLLKEHLKVIKNEMSGKNPTEIAFLPFYKLDAEEKARFNDGLKEACRLLKTECRIFKTEF